MPYKFKIVRISRSSKVQHLPNLITELNIIDGTIHTGLSDSCATLEKDRFLLRNLLRNGIPTNMVLSH